MDSVAKSQQEIIPHSVDWTNRIPSTLTITSATASGYILPERETTATLFASANATISGKITSWTLQNGTDGEDYILVFKATASDSTIYTQSQLLKVRQEVVGV